VSPPQSSLAGEHSNSVESGSMHAGEWIPRLFVRSPLRGLKRLAQQ